MARDEGGRGGEDVVRGNARGLGGVSCVVVEGGSG